MRQLTFNCSTDDDRDFELVYQSLLFSPLPVAANERKAHGELLDKLERIGERKQLYEADGVTKRDYRRDEIRLYVTSGGTVSLSEAEYDLMKRHVQAMADAPGFPKSACRAIDALIGRLETLEKLDAQPTAVSA